MAEVSQACILSAQPQPELAQYLLATHLVVAGGPPDGLYSTDPYHEGRVQQHQPQVTIVEYRHQYVAQKAKLRHTPHSGHQQLVVQAQAQPVQDRRMQRMGETCMPGRTSTA